MDLISFIIYALATYRISRFFIEDHLFEPLREFVWKKFSPRTTKLGYLLTCFWCFSVWSATALCVGYILIPSVTFYVALIFALSAITGIINKLLDRD